MPGSSRAVPIGDAMAMQQHDVIRVRATLHCRKLLEFCHVTGTRRTSYKLQYTHTIPTIQSGTWYPVHGTLFLFLSFRFVSFCFLCFFEK